MKRLHQLVIDLVYWFIYVTEDGLLNVKRSTKEL